MGEMGKIAETALVHPDATIARDISIGPYSIIEKDVTIGKQSVVEDHVLIKAGTQIGERNRICHAALLGGEPQDLKFRGHKTGVVIGDNNTIREFVTIHRGTVKGGNTLLGNNCLIMAYVHIAHDCRVGNNVIIANATQMGGFVTVEDFVFLSALIPIHQFSRIGAYSIVGGGFRIDKDVVPFSLAGGEPLRIYGANTIGLKRNNFKKDKRNIIKKALTVLMDVSLNTAQAMEVIRATVPHIPEIDHLLTFIQESKRGIARG
jgi:UDP-N-acetylglucosamine acyltransferase